MRLDRLELETTKGVREEGRLGDNHTWIQRFHPVSQVREYVPWRHVLGGKRFKSSGGGPLGVFLFLFLNFSLISIESKQLKKKKD